MSNETNDSEMVETGQATAALAEQQQGYNVYVPDFTSSKCTLISSSFDRYNKTIKHCLEQEDIPVDYKAQSKGNNFFRNAKWSPDGSCLLTNSADDILRVFPLPVNVYSDSEQGDEILPFIPSLGVREGESIHDFSWFPLMNAQDPTTCCFVTSVRDHPVQLWDMASGTVQASYCAIDHTERFIGPNVLAFNLDGSKIYCGYENMIEIFDIQRPGASDSTKFATIPKRKSKKGQKGIISCIDFSPDYSGLYAAGSYSKSIGIYDETNNELCLKLTGMDGGGVTQVKFSRDGSLLFSASRHSNSILCWDIRDTANVLYELPRPGKTNQRISFDIDATGQFLSTGDQFGHALIYDIVSQPTDDENRDRLVCSFKAHDDLSSCLAFNPVYPVMASCSGQRKFQLPGKSRQNDESGDTDESDESGDTDESDESDNDENDDEITIDNTLKAWRVPGQYQWVGLDYQSGTVNNEETIAQ